MLTLSRSCFPDSRASKAPLQYRSSDEPENEADLADKGITSLDEVSKIFQSNSITRLTLSHNKLRSLPASIANLSNLEILNVFNNQLDELPTSLSSLTKLKVLNVGMNRLNALPRGFGAFLALEVLDATYNNLSERSFPANFFMLETLRALYLADNDFEYLPDEIGQLKNLQVLVLRDNDLIILPKELGLLTRLRELHIQNNRLTILPPELGSLDLSSQRSVVRMEGNYWVPPIADQLQLGVSHVIDYIRSDTYKFLFGRHSQSMSPAAIPVRNEDRKSKKISRIRQK